MFENKSLWEIFNMGGFTIYILLFCSILSLGVILGRLYTYYVKSRVKKERFIEDIERDVKKGDVNAAINLCNGTESPFASVIGAGLCKYGSEERVVSNAMERQIMMESVNLERHTSIVGTIGNIAVYIGLFGTVIGIVRSFHNISMAGAGGISVVIAGVAEALICTATGLLVAIPSVVAYNYFVRRVDNFVTDMEYCASALLDIIATYPCTKDVK